jgi:sialate O-acetylesterase
MKKNILALLLVSAITATAHADVRLPRIFSSHMVFQRNKPIAVWGWAKPGENIGATIGEVGSARVYAKADKKGNWSLQLPAMPAGGPYKLYVTGMDGTIVLEDVLIGEVWVCSGQSNMEFMVKDVTSAEKEMAAANNPMIRHFKVPLRPWFEGPRTDLEGGEWQVASPVTVGDFTAVGYFFARELYAKLKVPIGLINTSWGGTMVETWISGPTFFSDPLFADQKANLPKDFNSILKSMQDKQDALLKSVQGSLPTAAEAAGFKGNVVNDQAWTTMNLPSLWESQGLPDVDGVVWFRKEFQLPADMNLANARLMLGPIDDADSTWVNGVFVGSVNSYNQLRNYAIPPNVLRPGPNSISIKVTDTGGGGGFSGDKDDLKITIGSFTQSLAGPWKFRIERFLSASETIGPNSYPALLYNGMVHPIINYRIAGALWYQGESNAGRAAEYAHSFPLMINDWRKAWKDELPFYFVQLASWEASGGTNQNGGSDWAELRESQTKTLALPNTGMAVTIDIGESKDIHPRNKQDVGKRLAAQALDKQFHLPGVSGGPVFDHSETRGKQMVLYFKQAGSGLMTKSRYGYVNAFEVAGADQKFQFARAWVEGTDKIVVESESVADIKAVRYAWADDPNDVNLYNKEGFPAQPFRTDNWPMKTAKEHYTID